MAKDASGEKRRPPSWREGRFGRRHIKSRVGQGDRERPLLGAKGASGPERRPQPCRYPPDTRVPTESELVETYEVARSTARRAVAAPREEGLVYTVQARDTYVARLDGATR
jgi:Bacterial regulatory proteins, gntR family